MASRYGKLALYSILLLAATATLCTWLGRDLAWPGPLVWLAAVAAFLFVWTFGVRAPAMGLVSLERIPQFGLLLVFDPVVAATLNAAAALIWPFTNRDYNLGSMKVAALRAAHNMSMVALMMLAAGYVYRASGGEHPLRELDFADLGPLLLAALTMQAVNNAMLIVYYVLDGRDPRRLFNWLYVAGDLLFVPGGVLGAVLLTAAEPAVFWLFAGLIAFFVLSFNVVARGQSALEAQLGAIRSAQRAGSALSGANRVDALAEHILAQTRALVRFDEFYLVLVDREHVEIEFRLHEREGERLPTRRTSLDRGLFGWVIESGTSVLVEDWSRAAPELRQRSIRTGKPTGSFIAVPLQARGETIGLISVQHTDANVYARPDLDLVQSLADRAAGALADAQAFEALDEYKQRLEQRVALRTAELEDAGRERERLLAELERQNREDSLTGLANRREFDRRLAQELERAQRQGSGLAVVLIDADHFKQINDRHGHAAGDAVLRELGELLRAQCRSVDVVARFGGEEFAILVPGTDAAAAAALAERVRAAVEAHDWNALRTGLVSTISAGLAAWSPGMSTDALLRSADLRLYAAKRTGRNRVVARDLA